MFLLIPMGVLAQGWPANYKGVMLQGFFWDSYEDAKWTTLTSQVDELSQYFKLIWVPNSGQTKEDQWNSPGNWGYENMGYMPVYWLKHNTCFGTQEELMQMIQTFKEKGTGFIEDVVINHKNGLTNWADFPNESVTGPTTSKNYTVTWATDMSDLWGICSNDEVFTQSDGLHDGVQYTCNSNAHADEADNFDGCRDLDHTNAQVQENINNYLDFLLDELGYVGFRYDMVKGYKAYYTGLYNVHAQPEFSVGEYWDSSYDNVVGYWITETGIPADGVPQSAAFDFPLKYKINEAFNNSNWSVLENKGIAGDPNMSRYAVTFVDNHDTYRNNSDRVNENVLAANAFILTMPGTPCVFLPHWQQYKPEIKKMIAAREAAGITNQSPITAQYEVGENGDHGYYLKVTGTKGSIILTLGNLLHTNVDLDQHELVISGNNFAMYLWYRVYDQSTYDAIDAESAKDITVYVKNNSQGNPYLYTWNGGNKLNGGWPGKQMTEIVTLEDGTSWYKQTFHISSLNAIVTFNDGKQTEDVENITDDIYLCYYKGDDKKHADYTSYYKGDISGNTLHAYFDAPSGWNKAWAWCTNFYDVVDKNYTGGTWPGETMTKVGTSSTGNDIYRWNHTMVFSEGVPNKIIFSGNGGQTGTLDFINGAYYDTSGLAAEKRLNFYPTVLNNATTVNGTNWNGTTENLAQGNASTTMEHALYYPAGDYTVQAIVRGTEGGQVSLNVGPADLTNASTAMVGLTGLDGAESTVTIDGVVECVETGLNNGWHKVQAHYVLAEEGVLKITLTSDASTWQVGAITIVKSADTQDYYRTTATQTVTETNAAVTSMSNFSFYDRGVNKNALVIANSGQAPAQLPCNVVVNGACPKLVLTDGAYDFFVPTDFSANSISYDRNFTADKKVTVCLPFDITAQEMTDLGIKAYEFIEVTATGSFRFSQVDAMEANHPYVVMASGKVFENLDGKTVKKTDALEIDVDGVTFKGTTKRMVLNSGDDAVYYGYSNGQFVKVGSNVGINPFRAFVMATGSGLGDAVQTVFDTDGIYEVNMQNMEQGVIYSIDGRKMGTLNAKNSLPKGLYIYNGTKFIVK